MAAVFLSLRFPLASRATGAVVESAGGRGFPAQRFTLSEILGPLNGFGSSSVLYLHAIVSPVVMGLLFYSTVTPIGVLFRWLGKDPLRLRIAGD